ncbi:uncharacterized protein LOC143851334 [Tasmannia lanceolata]|uniref:uncharacterized protein LOC143851334 n=1 Tax=Tasmannia lanceolata TaxID=3420 RepID=UPI0040637DC0
MDPFQHKRSSHSREKPLDFKSKGGNTVLMERSHREGKGHIKRRMDGSKMVLDSSLDGSIPSVDNSFAFKFMRSSSKEATVTPVKMPKEKEARQRSPSVIARLMGLDALPIQPLVHRQKKMFEDCFHRTSTGFQEKYASYEDLSFRKNIVTGQEEFKDVFEVTETSKIEKHNNRLVQKENVRSKPSEAKMNFIRQNFLHAKRLSTDENLRQSKEFHDALEVLDSNKDLLLELLQEPDSFFTTHLHDLHSVPIPPQSSHITVLKSSKVIPKNGDICWKPDTQTEGRVQMNKDAMNSRQKHENDNISRNKHSVVHSRKSVKTRFDVESDACFLPTRIVVLKPSIGKAQNMDSDVSSNNSSESSHSVHRKRREFRRLGNRELFLESRHRPPLANNEEPVRHRPKAPREIAREITQQMRRSVGSGSINVLTSGRRGHFLKGNSYNMSAKDSPNGSDELTSSSRRLYDSSNRYRPSLSHSTDSSVSREATKRLSERWNMTHMFQKVGLVDRSSSTLGEMLSLPDRQIRPALDYKIGHDGSIDKSMRNEVLERWDCPLGISSRDGWKDECCRNLSRFRSLSPPSTVHGYPKTRIRRGALSSDTRFMLKEATNLDPDKFKEDFFKQKETSSFRSIKSSSKKSECLLSTGMEDKTIREIHVSSNDLKNGFKAEYQFEQRAVVPGWIDDEAELNDQILVVDCDDSKMSREIHEDELSEPPCMMLVNDRDETHEDKLSEPPCMISVNDRDETHEDKLSEPPCMMLVNDRDATAYDQNDLIMEETLADNPEVGSHCHVAEPESPQSSKEAEQPSPVSVLEPLSEVEVSSSECFERVSADLHGLQMQLQLLKLESIEPSTDELEIIVSSDEETGEGCDGLPEEKEQLSGMFIEEENRSFSFLFDVLVTSGFHGGDGKIVFPTWDPSELPVGPDVFEKLENKYGKQLAWLRSDMKLLFDHINLGLAEILRPWTELYPWVKPKGRRTWVVPSGEALVEQLSKLLVRHSKEGQGDSAEKVMGRQVGWLELEEDVDTIGREIERLLLDELMEEVKLDLSSCGEI